MSAGDEEVETGERPACLLNSPTRDQSAEINREEPEALDEVLTAE